MKMLTLGVYHNLEIDRDTPPGLFLKDAEGNEVLLPNKYKPDAFDLGDKLEVFVYLDHQERPVATTLKPYITLDDFGYLKCEEVNEIGAFLDWGLEKHLFVPFLEQAYPMKKGEWYLVFCYLDLDTERLVASSKVNAFLDNSELTVEVNEEVDLIVTNKTELGFNVIVNRLHQGLIYHNQVFQPLQTGDNLKGVVKKIRPNGKMDVILQRPGYRGIEPSAKQVMNELELHQGFLPLHDKSSPEEIQKLLQMSKKSFKKAIGTLYKQRFIDIKPDGIYLQS